MALGGGWNGQILKKKKKKIVWPLRVAGLPLLGLRVASTTPTTPWPLGWLWPKGQWAGQPPLIFYIILLFIFLL
jgi:hypothetical protein